MNQAPDLKQMGLVSFLLSQGIPVVQLEDVPQEIVQTLARARLQMQNLPDCLHDLAEAERKGVLLAQAIEQLIELAQEAADLPEEDQEGRDRLQVGFVRQAKTLAELAGRKDYKQPQLSVQSRPLAQAAVKTLKHLIPAKTALAAQLRRQAEFIQEAIRETIGFLRVIAYVYPEVPALADLPGLLKEVGRPADDSGVKRPPLYLSETRFN